MNIENLCYGCMREKENTDERCPCCGFDNASYEKTRSTRALPLGTILNGKYLLGKVLGEGGFGITYLAMDLNLEMPVAIKEYFPVGLASRDTSIEGSTENVSVITGEKKKYYDYGIKSFASEAKNLAKFRKTDGIISVTDFFLENSTAYLVMEYIDGKTLKEYLEEKETPLSEEETLRLIRPVLNALSQIHEERIIHRDISPENIMIAHSGQVVLIDFGAARISTGAETKSLTVLLKHGYAPVEQYQTKGKQGPYTDIYAICATMYRMMSGEKPEEAIDRMVDDKVIPLEQRSGISVSHHVSAAIQKGLSVQPKDRFQAVEELEEELFEEEPAVMEERYVYESQDDNYREQEKVERILEEIGYYEKEKKVKAWLVCLITVIVLIWFGVETDSSSRQGNSSAQTLNQEASTTATPEETWTKGSAQVDHIDITQIKDAKKLVELIENNYNIVFDYEKDRGEYRYDNNSSYIFIGSSHSDGSIDRVYWKNIQFLTCKDVTVGMDKKEIEKTLKVVNKTENQTNYYIVDFENEEYQGELIIDYDAENKAKYMRFYGV